MRTLSISMLLLVALAAIGVTGCSSEPAEPVAIGDDTPEQTAAISAAVNYDWQSDYAVLNAMKTIEDPEIANVVAEKLTGSAAAVDDGGDDSGPMAVNLSEMTDEEKEDLVAKGTEKLNAMSADELDKLKADLLAATFPEEFKNGIDSEDMRLQLRAMLGKPELLEAFKRAVEASDDLKTAVDDAKEKYPKLKEAIGE
jgi:hypothetical protein